MLEALTWDQKSTACVFRKKLSGEASVGSETQQFGVKWVDKSKNTTIRNLRSQIFEHMHSALNEGPTLEIRRHNVTLISSRLIPNSLLLAKSEVFLLLLLQIFFVAFVLVRGRFAQLKPLWNLRKKK